MIYLETEFSLFWNGKSFALSYVGENTCMYNSSLGKSTLNLSEVTIVNFSCRPAAGIVKVQCGPFAVIYFKVFNTPTPSD